MSAAKTTQELANRVESSLRGLEYVDELPFGGFRAINWSMECVGYTHIDGVRHERFIYTDNLLSGLYRAFAHSFRNIERGKTDMAKLNGLLAERRAK